MNTDVLVEVRCQFRCVREKSIAIWDGIRTDATGEEEWTWLPRSKVSWVHKGDDLAGPATVTMPEWLARERGLPWRTQRTLAEWRLLQKARQTVAGDR